MILGVVVLKVTGISYEQYNEGGKYISFFLEPATVAFAIPLYKKRDVLKKYWLEILTALTIGSFGSLVAVYFAGKVIGMDNHLVASILPALQQRLPYLFLKLLAALLPLRRLL